MKPGPFIIGATGGSGTRVVAEVLKVAGVHMGHDLNEANDTRSTRTFRKTWARRYLEADYGKHFSTSQLEEMQQSLRTALNLQMTGISDQHVGWGWKNPPNVLLMKCYFDWLPNCQFIHLLRDGRDMAFSGNRGQLNKFGKFIMTQAERDCPEWQQKLIFWARTNLLAARVGSAAGPQRYLQLRFEDLTRNPESSLARLATFTGLSEDRFIQGQNLIHLPRSIGRWRERAEDLRSFHSAEVHDALLEFDYT